MTHVDVAECARTAATIVEVDCAKSRVGIGWQSGKNYSNIVLGEPVATITAGG